ncbi:MAG TPA: serine hydroxymethyltransferase [Stellaceae bacterium]|jgi:glycine hydroxymethyltransferase|nr:serine hydroxymethyltransferase [Stellaceae bacterium]
MTEWNELFTADLATADPEIARLIAAQERQNRATINLVASETYCPAATLAAEASELVNKNAGGYPPRLSFNGGATMDAIELLAIQRAKAIFGAEHANIQALTATIANIAVLRALLRPDDRVLSFDMAAGGHGSHGDAKHISGMDYAVRSFGVEPTTGAVDYEAARHLAREFRPRMLIAGSSSYPLALDFRLLAEIAGDVGALLFCDIAHVSGLVIAGLHDNPTPYSDVVTTSTHKTFCGPRTGGLVLCKAEHAAAIDAAIAPGLQAAPGGHIIAARAVLFEIVRKPAYAALMRHVAGNAQALAEGLREAGAVLYAGGTNTHMVVIDLRDSEWTETALNGMLLDQGVTANTTDLPPRGGRLGLRLGSTAMTIRGMDAAAFHRLGSEIGKLLTGDNDPRRAGRIADWARQFPLPYD